MDNFSFDQEKKLLKTKTSITTVTNTIKIKDIKNNIRQAMIPNMRIHNRKPEMSKCIRNKIYLLVNMLPHNPVERASKTTGILNDSFNPPGDLPVTLHSLNNKFRIALNHHLLEALGPSKLKGLLSISLL